MPSSFINDVRDALDGEGNRHAWPMYEMLARAIIAIDDICDNWLLTGNTDQIGCAGQIYEAIEEAGRDE